MTLSRVCCWLLNTEQKLLSSPVSRYRADAGHSYKLDCGDTSVFMGHWRGSLALVLSGAGLLGARPDWGQPGYSKPNLGVAALRLSASATIWRDSNMFCKVSTPQQQQSLAAEPRRTVLAGLGPALGISTTNHQE